MSVALINLLSTLSVAQPSAAVPEKPADAPNDTTVQAFAEILATIFGKPLPQPPTQPPVQLLKEDGSETSTELKPEFQSRLDRVVERMRDEFGHQVTVVEGFRTQQRQDALYEQGRTRPGNIVTWTKSSKHSEGLAADVKIDGTYNNAVGYERLAQIAEEEGLRTLGSKDPGHIELAGSVSSAVDRGSSIRGVDGMARLQTTPRVASIAEGISIAEIAEPAPVAKVSASATVATVAKVAEVAKPGEMRPQEPGNASTQSTALPARVIEAPAIPQQNLSANGDAKREKPATPKQRNQETSIQPGKTANHEFPPLPAIPEMPVRSLAPQASISAPNIPAIISNTDAVSRATKVTELQEASSNQSKSQVTLKIENEDGGTDRIRLNMRGTSIDTTIAVSEVSRAEQMAQRTGELRRSLEQLGLAPQTVRITTQKDQYDQQQQHQYPQRFNHPRSKSQRNHEERQR